MGVSYAKLLLAIFSRRTSSNDRLPIEGVIFGHTARQLLLSAEGYRLGCADDVQSIPRIGVA